MKRLFLLLILAITYSCKKDQGSSDRLRAPSVPLGFNSWYNNTLDDSIGIDINAAKRDIDWVSANKFSLNYQYVSLYISASLIKHPNFPAIASYAYRGGIRIGVAYSETTMIDDIISYNLGKPTDQKIQFAVSEIEPYNTGNYAGMTAVIKYAYPKLKANGLKNIIYMGWPTPATYWDTLITYSDQINLHVYRTSSNMTPASVWSYAYGRLVEISDACSRLNKPMPVNIIYSCEPAFAYTYFQNNTWASAHSMFLSEYNANATALMKKYITVASFSIFVTKYAKQIKPL